MLVGRPRRARRRARRSARRAGPARRRGTTTVRPPRPASSHAGVPRRAPGSASSSSPKRTTAPSSASPASNTCTWPRPITVTVPGRTGTVAPSIECCPRPRGSRSARGSRGGAARGRASPPKRASVEPHDLGGAAVEAVEGEPAHRHSLRSRRWRQRKAASNTNAISPPAVLTRGANAISSIDSCAGRHRHERAVVVPGRARPHPRTLAEAAAGLDRLEADVVVVDRQHAEREDPRAPERALADLALAGHPRQRPELGVDAGDRGRPRPHRVGARRATTEETRKDRIVA